jgi:hypothetical protein
MNASKKGGETMNILSKEENREIPFSRRFTLREIWGYLDKKYPENSRTVLKGSMKKNV